MFKTKIEDTKRKQKTKVKYRKLQDDKIGDETSFVSRCSFPADTDVFKTYSGRAKTVTTSYDQTRRRLEKDVGFTTS